MAPHGSLSSGGHGNDTLRTAVARETVAGGTTTDNLITLEASEDRYIRGIFVQTAVGTGETGNVQAEVSFSSTNAFFSVESMVDETGSGVLAYTFSRADSASGWAQNAGDEQFLVDMSRLEGNIEWDEGDELNVHASNGADSGEAIRIIVYYERVHDC